MILTDNLNKILTELKDKNCQLIAVSKTHPSEIIKEAYDLGLRVFGENKVQEMVSKQEVLPKDIQWHLIGHLQTNKVKYIAAFVHLIHSIDSFKLLKEVNKEAFKNNRIIPCLLQVHIAEEETKFGFSFEAVEDLLQSEEIKELKNIKIVGLMGMATNTDNQSQIREEFHRLKLFFDAASKTYQSNNIDLKELSIGMSSDYAIAVEEGSTMIRVGSAIFGYRDYSKLN